jgi:hypothetical protein
LWDISENHWPHLPVVFLVVVLWEMLGGAELPGENFKRLAG